MNCLLINPPIDHTATKKEYSFEAYMPPLGLLYLASSLKKSGHSVKLIDFVAEPYTDEKLKKEAAKFELVGITATSYTAGSVSKLTYLIKQFNQKLNYLKSLKCIIMRNDLFDYKIEKMKYRLGIIMKLFFSIRDRIQKNE
jgi:hypothetical protein